ncbi:MAG: phosphotransferase, partial [Actinobacteria bacterium]|nr:phosphotransferase [Actinomycetota bacterium]
MVRRGCSGCRDAGSRLCARGSNRRRSARHRDVRWTGDGLPFCRRGPSGRPCRDRRRAARLLARIHRRIAAAWTGKRVRASTQPPSIGRGELDPRLRDRELDLWERSIEATEPPLPIHGDYYAGNLFVKGMLVIGVIDWSDARLEHHEQEVAWAMWE